MPQDDKLRLGFFGASDIGLVRKENQDSFGKFPVDSDDRNQSKGLLFIVADGMGGHVGGKDASQSAVEIISQEYYSFSSEIISNCLTYAFKTANFRIHQSSRDEIQSHRKGTTCSALVIEKHLAYIAHVGDSRIYRINDDKIEQLTNDHTQVEEMLKKGILSEEEAKNHPSKSILVRALGIESEVEVDTIENIEIIPGDNFVLCSDGLAKVSPSEIKGIVLLNSPEDACNELIKLANDRGGNDNVTVQIIRVSHNGEDSYYQQSEKNPEKSSRWAKFTIMAAILITLIVLALIFQKKLVGFFNDENNSVSIDKDNTNIFISDDVYESLLIKAEKYVNEGKLDSAVYYFKLILHDNPMHVGALNGIDLVTAEYTRQGNHLKDQQIYSDALIYFQKAAELNPTDKNLAVLIAICKRELKNQSNPNSNNRTNDITPKIKTEFDNEASGDKINIIENNLLVSSFLISDWSFDNLTDNDFTMGSDALTFFSSGKIKRGIFSKRMEDFDVKVSLLLPNKSVAERAGIIVGFNVTDDNQDIYYLFSADTFGNFLLRKFSNGKEEKLIAVQRKINQVNNGYSFNLKIKCLGPWIMIYNDDKLLESWLNKDFVKGNIGLFAESGTQAEFSNFKVTSAFESKEIK